MATGIQTGLAHSKSGSGSKTLSIASFWLLTLLLGWHLLANLSPLDYLFGPGHVRMHRTAERVVISIDNLAVGQEPAAQRALAPLFDLPLEVVPAGPSASKNVLFLLLLLGFWVISLFAPRLRKPRWDALEAEMFYTVAGALAMGALTGWQLHLDWWWAAVPFAMAVTYLLARSSPEQLTIAALQTAVATRGFWVGGVLAGLARFSGTLSATSTLLGLGALSVMAVALARPLGSEQQVEDQGAGADQRLRLAVMGRRYLRFELTVLIALLALLTAFPAVLEGAWAALSWLAVGGLALERLSRQVMGLRTKPRPKLRSLARIGACVGLAGSPFLLLSGHPYWQIWVAGTLACIVAGSPWRATGDENLGGWCHLRLTPLQEAAVLIMALPPEQSAQIFSHLGPNHVQQVTLAITTLPSIHPSLRKQILERFETLMGSDWLKHRAGVEDWATPIKQETIENLRALGRGDIELTSPTGWTAPPRVAQAIALMTLPPEISARFFAELGPEEVQQITLEITKLPKIDANLRAQAESLMMANNLEDYLGEVARVLNSRYLTGETSSRTYSFFEQQELQHATLPIKLGLSARAGLLMPACLVALACFLGFHGGEAEQVLDQVKGRFLLRQVSAGQARLLDTGAGLVAFSENSTAPIPLLGSQSRATFLQHRDTFYDRGAAALFALLSLGLLLLAAGLIAGKLAQRPTFYLQEIGSFSASVALACGAGWLWLPAWVFLALTAFAWGLERARRSFPQRRWSRSKPDCRAAEIPSAPLLEITLGRCLAAQANSLSQGVAQTRALLASTYGVELPPVKLRESRDAQPTEVVISVRGMEVMRYHLDAGELKSAAERVSEDLLLTAQRYGASLVTLESVHKQVLRFGKETGLDPAEGLTRWGLPRLHAVLRARVAQGKSIADLKDLHLRLKGASRRADLNQLIALVVG